MLVFDLLFRFLHILSVVVVAGGSIYMRFVLMPSAATLPDEQHDQLRRDVMRRWRKIVGIGIGGILGSGIYNIIRALPNHKGDGVYHMLFGIKFLAAMAVFFLASALVGRAAAFEGIRRENKKWMLVTITLVVIVIAISGYLKLGTGVPPVPEAS